MKNMCTILMYMNFFYILCIYISRNIRTFINYQNRFPRFFCFTGKHCPI